MDTPTTEHDPNTIPKRTTPTWEMEVLLSGATVFAVWQLFGAMAPAIAYLTPRLPAHFGELGGVLYIYVAGGLAMIGLAFALHLVLRAYWVALVGMHSVFPGGLRMDGIKAGPVAKKHLLARWPDTSRSIDAADNRATIVFGLGFGVAAILVPITLVVSVIYSITLGVCWALGRLDAVIWVFLALTAAFLLPYLGAQLLDRALGDRILPGTPTFRAFDAVFRLYRRFGMSRESNPLVTLYSSNVGDRRGNVVVVSIMLVSMLLAALMLARESLHLGPGGFGGFPSPWRGTEATVDGRHYATMQEPGATVGLPFLPSPSLRGNYARLVVPYLPSRHAGALAGCAEGADEAAGEARESAPRKLRDSLEESAHRGALLACFAKHFEVRLDGELLATPPDWYLDPSRDLRGLLFMVPLEGLAPGRHELQVVSPDDRTDDNPDAPASLPDRIPFWR